jgi:hypothetical protein
VLKEQDNTKSLNTIKNKLTNSKTTQFDVYVTGRTYGCLETVLGAIPGEKAGPINTYSGIFNIGGWTDNDYTAITNYSNKAATNKGVDEGKMWIDTATHPLIGPGLNQDNWYSKETLEKYGEITPVAATCETNNHNAFTKNNLSFDNLLKSVTEKITALNAKLLVFTTIINMIDKNDLASLKTLLENGDLASLKTLLKNEDLASLNKILDKKTITDLNNLLQNNNIVDLKNMATTLMTNIQNDLPEFTDGQTKLKSNKNNLETLFNSNQMQEYAKKVFELLNVTGKEKPKGDTSRVIFGDAFFGKGKLNPLWAMKENKPEGVLCDQVISLLSPITEACPGLFDTNVGFLVKETIRGADVITWKASLEDGEVFIGKGKQLRCTLTKDIEKVKALMRCEANRQMRLWLGRKETVEETNNYNTLVNDINGLVLDAQKTALDAQKKDLDAQKTALDAQKKDLDAQKTALDAQKKDLTTRRVTLPTQTTSHL